MMKHCVYLCLAVVILSGCGTPLSETPTQRPSNPTVEILIEAATSTPTTAPTATDKPIATATDKPTATATDKPTATAIPTQKPTRAVTRAATLKPTTIPTKPPLPTNTRAPLPTATQAVVQPPPPQAGGYVCADGSACIKGNINSDGKKLYHFPGCPSYNATKIDTSKGERWFTSSAEAEAAGWTRAGNCPQ